MKDIKYNLFYYILYKNDKINNYYRQYCDLITYE